MNGRTIYLGKYDTPESYERYAKLIDEWQAQRREGMTATNDVLALQYLKHRTQKTRNNRSLAWRAMVAIDNLLGEDVEAPEFKFDPIR